jgi:hypothetical protein
MDAQDLERIFGQPSELLVQEAVWIYREEQGSWPIWSEVVDSLAAFLSVDSRTEAEERLAHAVCNGEVVPRLQGRGRGHSFTFRIPEETCDRIARRILALRTTPLPDEEASC